MRVKGWERKLANRIERIARAEFKWGETDCSLFAADVVGDLIGKDLAKAFRGRYSTPAGAERALRRYGRGDLLSTVTEIMEREGFEEIEPLFGQRGDLAYVMPRMQPAIGVVDMSGRFVVGIGLKGLVSVPLKDAVKVWRIN